MLNCWLTDEPQWPQDRTQEMFREWFDVQLYPSVENLHVDEELIELGSEGSSSVPLTTVWSPRRCRSHSPNRSASATSTRPRPVPPKALGLSRRSGS